MAPEAPLTRRRESGRDVCAVDGDGGRVQSSLGEERSEDGALRTLRCVSKGLWTPCGSGLPSRSASGVDSGHPASLACSRQRRNVRAPLIRYVSIFKCL